MSRRDAPLWGWAVLFPAATLLAGPAWGAAITLTATTLSVDAATGVAVAEGPVRLTDGVTVGTGRRLVLDTRRQLATLTTGTARTPQGTLTAQTITARYQRTRLTRVAASGAASMVLPRGTLKAAEMVLLVADEQLTASGGVRLSTPPNLTATGARLHYRRRTEEVTMAGPVTVQTPQGWITGSRLTGQVTLQRARLAGPVKASFGAINADADEAALDVPAKTLTLTGSVRLRQGSRLLQASKVTVYYTTGRVVAEGTTHLEIPGEPAAPRQ